MLRRSTSRLFLRLQFPPCRSEKLTNPPLTFCGCSFAGGDNSTVVVCGGLVDRQKDNRRLFFFDLKEQDQHLQQQQEKQHRKEEESNHEEKVRVLKPVFRDDDEDQQQEATPPRGQVLGSTRCVKMISWRGKEDIVLAGTMRGELVLYSSSGATLLAALKLTDEKTEVTSVDFDAASNMIFAVTTGGDLFAVSLDDSEADARLLKLQRKMQISEKQLWSVSKISTAADGSVLVAVAGEVGSVFFVTLFPMSSALQHSNKDNATTTIIRRVETSAPEATTSVSSSSADGGEKCWSVGDDRVVRMFDHSGGSPVAVDDRLQESSARFAYLTYCRALHENYLVCGSFSGELHVFRFDARGQKLEKVFSQQLDIGSIEGLDVQVEVPGGNEVRIAACGSGCRVATLSFHTSSAVNLNSKL